MQETLQLILTYVRMIWRFRWLALTGSFALCLAGWAFVVLMPNQYEVETRVYLDTRSLLRPILKGLAFDTDINRSTADLMRRTLLVRPNLEEVARKTDMDLKAKTPEDLERLLDSLAEEISVSGTSRDNIFLIGYIHTDPKLATKVVEAILNIFVEKSLGESRKDTSKTRQFIERQISEYESRLDAAEERLKEFKQRNFALMPGSGGGSYHQRLSEATENLARAEQDLREVSTRAKILEQQLEGQVPTFGIGPAVPAAPDNRPAMPVEITTPLDNRVAQLQGQLDQLLLQFTDKHPDVVSLRRLLESTAAERDAMVQKKKAAFAAQRPLSESPVEAQPLRENPVYQELQIAFGKAQAEVAVQSERVKQSRDQIDELQSKVDTIFKVEAELKRLNRDYEINRANYDGLLQRREALKIGEEAGQSTDDVQFNILEPPREPVIPIGPNRGRLSIVVLLAGLAAGVGLAFLLALLRPGIYDRGGIREITDLPVLGTVSRIWTRGERFRRRMEVVSFASATIALLTVFVGLMILHAAQIDIKAKVLVLGRTFL